MEESLYQHAIKVSKPPPEAQEFDPPHDLIFSVGGKVPLRNIFSFKTFSDFETEKLFRLKQEVQKSKLQIPSDWDDAFLLRIVHGSGYKTRKALKDLKNSIEAYKTLVPSDIKTIYSSSLKVLNEGFLYVFGRDKYFRPAIIMDCTKVNIKKFTVEQYVEATVFLTEFVIKYMLIPGKVEGWVNLVEMGGWGLRELPLKSLMKISATLQHVYKCRLAHSFVINPPSSIYYIWNLFKPFIDKVTQSKIVIVKKGISKEMLDLYEPEQLEKKFGGTSENLTSFWPPVFPNTQNFSDVEKDLTEQGPLYCDNEEEFRDESLVQVKKKKKMKKNKKKRKRDDDDIDKSVFSSSSDVIRSEHDQDCEEIYLNVEKKFEAFEEVEESLKVEVEIDIKSEMDEKEIVKREKKERKKKKKKKGGKEKLEDTYGEKVIKETSLVEENNVECSQKVPIVEGEEKTAICGCNSGCLIC